MRNLHHITPEYTDIEKALIYAVQRYSTFVVDSVERLNGLIYINFYDNTYSDHVTSHWAEKPSMYDDRLLSWVGAGRPEPQPFSRKRVV